MIADWGRSRGHSMQVLELFHGDGLPSLNGFDALVLMGGPMSVNDEALHPWLALEKDLVRRALLAPKKVLGVCLGAQLMAAALGAPVAPMGYREIGWHPLRAVDPQHPWVAGLNGELAFHWHGEAFEVPPGARLLLSSEACANQAFAWGSWGLGLQCHLETDLTALQAMLAHGGAEVAAGGVWVQDAATMIAQAPDAELLSRRCAQLLDRFFAD